MTFIWKTACWHQPKISIYCEIYIFLNSCSNEKWAFYFSVSTFINVIAIFLKFLHIGYNQKGTLSLLSTFKNHNDLYMNLYLAHIKFIWEIWSLLKTMFSMCLATLCVEFSTCLLTWHIMCSFHVYMLCSMPQHIIALYVHLSLLFYTYTCWWSLLLHFLLILYLFLLFVVVAIKRSNDSVV